MDECTFILKTLDCYVCGQPTPYVGTCKDTAICPSCRKKELAEGNISHKNIIRGAEEYPYWGLEFNDIDNNGRYK